MRELLLSELRRFRQAAMLAAAGHLLALFLVLRFRDFMQMHAHSQLLLLAIYIALAFGFGLYHFGSYRQPNRWMWLMHRPLPAWQVAAAIGGASAILFAAVFLLPGVAALAAQRLLTTRVVALEHYAVVLHASLFAYAAWLCAGYVMLNRSKLAATIVVLPFLLMFHITSIYALLALDLLCIAMLAATLAAAMKPNRLAPPAGAAAVLSTAVPLHLASYFVLAWGGSLAWQYGAILAGTHPLNTETAPAGGYTEAVRAEAHERMLAALPAQWRGQVGQKNTQERAVLIGAFPLKHQVAPLSQHQFDDPANKLRWTYSPDQDAFIGRHVHTGERKGMLAAPSLPILSTSDKRDAVTALYADHVDAYDPATRAWREILRLEPGEILQSDAGDGRAQRQYLITNKRLIVTQGAPVRRPVHSVTLPGPWAELVGVDVAELRDGMLLGFLFARHMIDGMPNAHYLILHMDSNGKVSEVARRALSHDFPLLFEHKDWWLSPALHAVQSLPVLLLDKPAQFPFNPLAVPRPWQAWLAAAVAALLAAGAGWWWLARCSVSPLRRRAWLAACLALGPPAFLSLAVMEARKPRLGTAGTPIAAHRAA